MVLGITRVEAQDKAITKNKFREKLSLARNNDENRARICLSYDIIVNNKFYKQCEKDVFRINDELGIDIFADIIIQLLGIVIN